MKGDEFRKTDTIIWVSDRILVKFAYSSMSIFANRADPYTGPYDWNLVTMRHGQDGPATMFFECQAHDKDKRITHSVSAERTLDILREYYPQDVAFILFHPEIFQGYFYEA